MTDASRLILVDAWRQCERHLHHLRHALDSLSSALPVTADSLSRFDDDALKAAYLNEAVSAVAQMESLLVHIQPLVNAH